MLEQSSVKETNSNRGPVDVDLAREVVRCESCGLVQFRTHTGNCRRCLRQVPPKVKCLILPAEPKGLPDDNRQLFEKWPNGESVKKIGQRIQRLRELREMTQKQLQDRSRVSRSCLSRIERGQMTPSLASLEKISEGIGVALNHFFAPLSEGEALVGDLFIQELRPFLRRLDWEQWQSILNRLAAISNNVAGRHAQFRPSAQPRPIRTRLTIACGRGRNLIRF